MLLENLVGVNVVALDAGAMHVAGHVVEVAKVLPLRKATRAVVRSHKGWGPADKLLPTAPHLVGGHIPVAHRYSAMPSGIATDRAHGVAAHGNVRVRGVQGDDAKPRAVLDGRRRLDERHSEGAGVPVMAQATAIGG